MKHKTNNTTTNTNTFAMTAVALTASAVLLSLTACGNDNTATSQAQSTHVNATPTMTPNALDVDAFKPMHATDVAIENTKKNELTLNAVTIDTTVAPSIVDLGSVSASTAKAAFALGTNTNEGKKPIRIGEGRTSPNTETHLAMRKLLNWKNNTQGQPVAALTIKSKDAKGLRMGLQVKALPDAAVVRFYGEDTTQAIETTGKDINDRIKTNIAAGDVTLAAYTYWSPYLEGERVTVQITLPLGTDPETVKVAVPHVSHFSTTPEQAANVGVSAVAPQSTGVGSSLVCEVDVSCGATVPAVSNAVAKMVFVDGTGGSYLCSGTLLNDNKSSGTPYFLSANHCIGDQTTASNLQTYWFYRSSTCNSGTVSSTSKVLSTGATLLYAAADSDTSFMRLNSAPPAGAVFAGWSFAQPTIGLSIEEFHHPKGDLQKRSTAQIFNYLDMLNTATGSGFFYGSAKTSGFLYAKVTKGYTEGGSSGSGIFVDAETNPKLIGQLYGTTTLTTTCGVKSDNIYGRFDYAYKKKLNEWLATPVVAPTPTAPTTSPPNLEITTPAIKPINITVRARGLSGNESVTLKVGDLVLKTWVLGRSITDTTVTTTQKGALTLAYTNDNSFRASDVQVDYIKVGTNYRLSEMQTTNTGVYQNGKCGGGNGRSRWLNCNGYIGYGDVT